jgi:hypothetical protein
MSLDKQALVPDVGETRKRWVVLLTNYPNLAAGSQLHEHPTDQVAPLEAIQEAVRKCIPYGYTFAPKHTGRALYDDNGNAVGHPSVTPQGWLVIKVSTEAGLELPGEWQVRLQGYGGARDTQIERIDDTDLGDLE